MSLSVAAALELEVFRRTTVEVLAGEDNLGRAVRWVHPVEIPDIARFLSGGELLLTAGLGIGRSPADQRRYIQEISDAGAAALVIELSGRAFTTMPRPLIEESRSRGFPLIALGGEIPFTEVSAQVHELIAESRTADLEAFERLNAEFIKLLLASGSHVSVTETLAYQIGCPVVLENSAHDLIAYAGGTTQTDDLIRNWGLHARVAHRSDDKGATHNRATPSYAPDEPRCSRRIIALRGEAWGWMHVFHGGVEMSVVHSYALDRAADAMAITLLGDREKGARSAQRQGSLVNRLLLGDITGKQFVDRALKIGRDLRDRPLVVVMLCKRPNDSYDDAWLEGALKPLRSPAVVADIGNHVVAVVGLNPQCSSAELTRQLGTHPACAGVSREVVCDDLPDAIRQARTAASVAAAKEPPCVLTFDKLGLRRLLVALAKGPELKRYVEDELGDLLAYDARDANPLLPTLRALLEADGNKSKAAELLFVRRRTLYYRLERLNALLGRSVEDPDVRSGLAIAVQALDFLEYTEAG